MSNLIIRVGEKYQLERRLGGGTFGEVYQARDLQNGHQVAVKLEYVRIDPSLLENEVEIYEALSSAPGIPRIYWHGHDCEFRVMAFELLGPNLEDLFNYCGRKFSLKTALLLADQLISRFQYIHSKGYIHRDVKPDNLLVGDGKRGHIVYVTDIGLAKEMDHRQGGSYPVVGTLRYASIGAHRGQDLEQSARDDMESLGYVLTYFVRGSLPWQGLKANTGKQKEELILQKKESMSPQELCEGLPEEFQTYFEHIRSLEFDEIPDYAHLRRLFRNLFRRSGYEYDYVFDWTILKFLQHVDEKASVKDCGPPP